MCSSTVRISCCRSAIVNRHSHNVGERRGLDAAALVRKLFVSIRGDILADDLTVVGDTEYHKPWECAVEHSADRLEGFASLTGSSLEF